jgi:hypothetical protein
MNARTSRLPIAGPLAGIVFAVGLLSVLLVPGGGTVTDQQFADFYGSGARRATALVLYVALVAGSWLMGWFFDELSIRVAPGRGEVARRVAWLGSAAVVIGGAVALAPTAVQANSGSGFVGVPLAHTFDQAGLLIVVVGGIYSFALAVLLLSLDARRSSAMPSWVGVSGIVVAVLLLASYVALPMLLLPLWAVAVGLGSRRPSGEPAAALAAGSPV